MFASSTSLDTEPVSLHRDGESLAYGGGAGTGHLFIVHGRLGDLTCDAVIVTNDDRGILGEHWQAAIGVEEQTLDMSTGWTRIDAATYPAFAVSIEAEYGVVLERIERCLGEIARYFEGRESSRGRGALPLVVLPVVGIGEGGLSDHRGDVVRDLAAHLTTVADDQCMDIALVTPDPAVWSAAQYARRGSPSPLPADLEDQARRLGDLARQRRLALFMGAGVSIPSGLPSWHTLLERLAEEFDVAEELRSANDFSSTDKAGLIEKTSDGGFKEVVATQFAGEHRPSLLHTLIAALDPREVITTNYDLLYEKAVRATGRGIASVMPWESALEKHRWILKLHGDIQHPKQIVLTRHHMVRYDAANRPSASMLQSLLLTRHTLFVGVSMTDDNVIRLMHEVDEYRSVHEATSSETFGTVLDVAGDVSRARLWNDQLTWLDLEHASEDRGTRVLELFLDRVALHASQDSSWLLDERFAPLLGADDKDLAQRARDLYADIAQRGGEAWLPLVEKMRDLGARSDRT